MYLYINETKKGVFDMAPQKMLYIKEEDLGLIDKAQLC